MLRRQKRVLSQSTTPFACTLHIKEFGGCPVFASLSVHGLHFTVYAALTECAFAFAAVSLRSRRAQFSVLGSDPQLGARLRGRTATQRSEKVLDRVQGSSEGFWEGGLL